MEQVEIPSMVSVSSSFPVGSDSGANNNNVPFGLTRRQRGICKYRGVVSLHNGTWGAQIYAKRTRIWLGTFKSEAEAAKAYDIAAVKLRREDSSCNFPRNLEVAASEAAFLSLFTDEAVVGMIKDRSYQAKFDEFLKAQQVPTDAHLPISKVGVHYSCCFHGEGIMRTELFDKELTPSDIGKLKRLVIPKKHATKHFPPAREDRGMELEFMDEFMKPWKFRYCYWESSQSYVFTKGWGAFVKEKWLKEKDVVVFYGYDQYVIGVCGELELRKFFMIEVRYSGAANGDVARLSNAGSSLFGGIGGSSGVEVEKKRGFKLFGFDITS